MKSTQHVLLCGPAEPTEILPCSDVHRLMPGMGGVPVNSLAKSARCERVASHGCVNQPERYRGVETTLT